MTFALSCTLADKIAAFGPLASAVTEEIDWCESRAPVIAFHGTADPLAPYEGGRVFIAPMAFPSIPQWIAGWAKRNGCAPGPVDSAVNADVTKREYVGYANGADTLLYTVKGAGHQWFGGMQGRGYDRQLRSTGARPVVVRKVVVSRPFAEPLLRWHRSFRRSQHLDDRNAVVIFRLSTSRSTSLRVFRSPLVRSLRRW